MLDSRRRTRRVLAFILGLGGLFAVIYGAAIAGSEWTWGTLQERRRAGRGPRRLHDRHFVAIVAARAVGLAIAFAVGVLRRCRRNLAGVSTAGSMRAHRPSREAGARLARGVGGSALGFAIATIARSQLAGIGAGIAFYFVEAFASLFLPDIVKYMPFTRGRRGGPASEAHRAAVRAGRLRLEPNTALLVVLAWLVGALVVSRIVTERAEITRLTVKLSRRTRAGRWPCSCCAGIRGPRGSGSFAAASSGCGRRFVPGRPGAP